MERRNRLFRMCTKEAPSVSFSSLPHDIILNVVARVPKRYYPILSFVSKKLRSLVGSSELDKTRSLLGKYDRFYVCCQRRDYFKGKNAVSDSQWYTLSNNHGLVLTSLPTPLEPYACALTVDHDIYFFGGRSRKRMWILDTRSGTLREGPNSFVASKFEAVGLVKDKIYVFEGNKSQGVCKDIQAQLFDLKTQTWQIAPNPDMKFKSGLGSVVSSSIDGKIFTWGGRFVIAYDSRDGKCDKILLADWLCFSYDMCVIDTVLYVHYPNVGLMWYDSKEKEWRLVRGVNLLGYYGDQFKMADYNGKLVFLWKHHEYEREPCVVSEVRCAMIALRRGKVAIQGRVEWSSCLSKIPYNYDIRHFLVCSD